MARYSQTVKAFVTSTSLKTAISIRPSATVGAELQEVIVTGSGSTAPADVSHRVELWRHTLQDGTAGSTPAPEKLDPGTAASGLTAPINFSVEPTVMASKESLVFAFNQRGGMRHAVPHGWGFKMPAATTNNIAVRIISSVAGAVDVTVIWEE